MRYLFLLILLLSLPRAAGAYSILTHEAVVDAAWDKSISPLLVKRFPSATKEEIKRSRAFAYGGAIMPDMGYFPFGSQLFSDLVHYTRSGDFVEALIGQSQNINEYAFALGALAHYHADNYGHPEGVNPGVPLVYPKLKCKHGDTITYEQDRIAHKRMEFGLDVLQVARGNYADSNYVDFIGFEVSKEVLERAFAETYGLELKSIFINLDLSIASFRWSVKDFLPMLTKAAWVNKKDDIQKERPGIVRSKYVYVVDKKGYIKTWNNVPLKVRITSLVMKVMPGVGIGRALRFRVPSAEAEKLFVKSFDDVLKHYRQALSTIEAGTAIQLENRNFDTGRPSKAGEYKLADKTFLELLNKLADNDFSTVTPPLEKSIREYYGYPAATGSSIATLYAEVKNTHTAAGRQ
jgi:hypothetical protein